MIVWEKYFGTFYKLWETMSGKYCWSEKASYTIFGVCVSTKSFNITFKPLRSTDDNESSVSNMSLN